MLTMLTSRGRRVVVSAVALLVLAVLPVTNPGSALAQGTPPTVGAIVVDSYDCATGELRFRAPVTNLPHNPEGFGTLGADLSFRYARGPLASPFPTQEFNPPPELAPYTGDVNLGRTVPSSLSSQDASEPSGPLVSIEIRVAVGDGSGQSNASMLIYAVDCGDDGDIVDQLIAVLVRILQDILTD